MVIFESSDLTVGMVSIGVRVLDEVEIAQRWQCQVSWYRFNNVFSAFCPGENKTKVFILVLEGNSRNLSGKLVTGGA